MLIRCSIIFLLTIVSSSAITDQRHNRLIRVLVSGATPNGGQVIGQIFNSEENYLINSESGSIAEVDESGAAVLQFKVNDGGSYAVAVYQDQNGNSMLDRTFIGIPKEPVGASNNPKSRFGPPKWKAARFSVTGEVTELEIQINSRQNQ